MVPARQTRLQEALQLGASITLAYWIGLALNWPSPKNAAIAIAVCSASSLGATIEKSALRVLGTALGAVTGWVLISGFGQTPWEFLPAMAALVLVVGYFIQNSRHETAWMLTGVTAAVVWSSSYGNVDDAFRIGLFRLLETATGVVVLSLVSGVLWRVEAGDELRRQAGKLLDAIAERSTALRRLLDGDRDAAMPRQRADLLVGMAALRGSLGSALIDSAAVRARRQAWLAVPEILHAFVDALWSWEVAARDCDQLPVQRALPELDAALARIEVNVAAARADWEGAGGDAASAARSPAPVARQPVRPADDAGPAEITRLSALARRTERLEVASGRLLELGRVSGAEGDLRPVTVARIPRPPLWDPQRLQRALFPTLCFVTSFVFWIETNPPAGNALPILAMAFGLILMANPVDLFKLIVPLVIGIALLSPLPMFLLPRLDSAGALLAVVFASTTLLGLLGGALRSLALLGFAIVTNLTNQQSYNFLGILYPIVMLLIGGVLITLVYRLVSAAQPEQALRIGLARFFDGARRFVGALRVPYEEHREARNRALCTALLPGLRQLRTAAASLGAASGAGRLQAALEAVLDRLQELERATVDPGLRERGALADLARIRASTERVLAVWSRSPDRDALRDERRELEEAAWRMREELDALPADDPAVDAIWEVLAGARGLLEAVAETQEALGLVDWDRWRHARFV